jgi:hypothetical protein
MMEKTLRVLSGGEEGGHSHSHSHSSAMDETAGHATGVSGATSDGLRKRGADEKTVEGVQTQTEVSTAKGPSKLSAYLNLFGDFVHNMYVFRPASADRCSLIQYGWSCHGCVVLLIAADWRDDDTGLLRARDTPRDCGLLNPCSRWLHEASGDAKSISYRSRCIRECTHFSTMESTSHLSQIGYLLLSDCICAKY